MNRERNAAGAGSDAVDLTRTRHSLLNRLKDCEDQKSWQNFFDRYAGLIRAFALKAGLSEAEAEDVVQETVIIVARKMPKFNYDPARGSFKTWLLLITRRRIEKNLDKRVPNIAYFERNEDRTAMIELIPDASKKTLEEIWEEEWRSALVEAALKRLKQNVKPIHYQIFDLYVLQEWPMAEVARALNVSATLVYVTKHRLQRLLRREISKLQSLNKPV